MWMDGFVHGVVEGAGCVLDGVAHGAFLSVVRNDEEPSAHSSETPCAGAWLCNTRLDLAFEGHCLKGLPGQGFFIALTPI
ncbi:hypothetical protein GCM10025792_04010 [Pseudonocardia tropica]